MTDVDIHPNWWNHATCAGTSANIFFPKVGPNTGRRGNPPDHDPYAHARRICAQCPVRWPCLTYATQNGIADGMWGGLDPTERRPRYPERACHECGAGLETSRIKYCSHRCTERASRRRRYV